MLAELLLFIVILSSSTNISWNLYDGFYDVVVPDSHILLNQWYCSSQYVFKIWCNV